MNYYHFLTICAFDWSELLDSIHLAAKQKPPRWSNHGCINEEDWKSISPF